MSTTDERDDGSIETSRLEVGRLDATAAASAEGDDIVVVPAPAEDPERRRRRRAVFALGGVVVAVLLIGAIALIARHNVSSNTTVRTDTPTTIAAKSISESHPKATAPAKKVLPVVVVTTVPQTSPPQTSPPQTSGTLGTVAPPPTTPVVAPTIAAPKQYGAAALTWTAPRTLTIVSGRTATLAVTAHNPTDGTVTLPHPLACTPRLDQSGICTEMAQLIPAGQSASAQYTIDAQGIAPGKYTLRIEGVLTVAVTVS